jgi:hypothetical protein
MSGGLNLPIACNDGSYSNAVSTNLSYTNGPLYITAAYEWHQNVNRQSDITSIYGASSLATLPTAYAQSLFNADVANEDAAKVAILYHFPTQTTAGGIFESMHRYVPADLQFQNERQRYGTWFVVSQQLTDADSLHFGWAHAFRTPGDPGQHNDATLTTLDGAGTYAPNDNQSDMLTGSYKHRFSENLTWYTAVAATFNATGPRRRTTEWASSKRFSNGNWDRKRNGMREASRPSSCLCNHKHTMERPARNDDVANRNCHC